MGLGKFKTDKNYFCNSFKIFLIKNKSRNPDSFKK